MNPRLARMLMGLYPRWWRKRYAKELEQLLTDEKDSLRGVADVVQSAMRERVRNGRNEPHWSFGIVATRVSALLPIAMSLAALSAVGLHVAFYGTAREADEGAVAHIWQILMAGQMPILVIFALKWVPRAPRQALCVLAAQAGAALASIAPVFLLGL